MPRARPDDATVVFAGDFETTTDPLDCRVWLWGIAELDSPLDLEWGIDLDSFVERISGQNSTIYFHNLKFDGHFIFDWLLKNGFTHCSGGRKKLYHMTFTTLISNMNKVYSLKICWANGYTTEFRDSLKKIPMPLARVAQTFKLETLKGEIDYHAYRPVGYLPTPEELEYLRNDVAIVAQAMSQVLDAGMTRLTVAADSLAEYKDLVGAKTFAKRFPVLADSMDSEIRRALRGGFTSPAKRFQSRLLGAGLVLDVNSLYPSIMRSRVLPYGEPVFKSGRVETTTEFPLAVFSVTFTAKLKPGHVPCIQVKGSSLFGATEYLEEIVEPVTLMITDIDFALYNDHYDMHVLEYGGGWLFRGTTGMFDAYVDKWSKIKENSVGGEREIAKLHLNSLFGKFGSNPLVTGKYPVLENDRVKFVLGPEERKDPVYTAVAVFVTAYARNLTIRAAQANYDVFAYADTDSLHLLTSEVPDSIDVHPTRMGAWALEYHFTQAFFVRSKVYVHLKDNCEYKTAWAGLPEHASSQLTFDDLTDGNVLHGKLHPKSVPGGVVLENVSYTLKL